MIKNNLQLITDWDQLYMKYNDEVGVDVFEKYCADEIPFIWALDDCKDEPEFFNNLVNFFFCNYAGLWHNNKTGKMEELEEETPEWFEGYEAHKMKVLALANYFKMQNIENTLTNLNK